MGLFDTDNLFGISLVAKNTKSNSKEQLETFVLEDTGGVEQRINPTAFSGNSNLAYEMATVPSDEIELLKKYRALAKTSELDLAVQEIKNEMFVFDVPNKRPFEISFKEKTKIAEKTQTIIKEEFSNLYNIIDFENKGLELFVDWYVDGKLFLQKVVDSKDLKKGIQKFVKVSPFNIRKIREYQQSDKHGIFDMSQVREYYVYHENSAYLNRKDGFKGMYGTTNSYSNNALIIKADTITYIDSGIYDENTGNALSFLYKAIVPYNQLKLIEDSHIIYMVTRAPSRRIFYIDVNGMSPPKAEAAVKSMMEKFRTKLMYDPSTGTVIDKRNILSMVEDYWFPRQDGKTTDVQELPAGDDQSTDYLEYLKNKLYHATNVPYSRLSSDSVLSYGKATEISRDERRMLKFIDTLRQRFMFIFEDALKTQLILKNIIKETEWEDIKNDFKWNYTEDNNFVEWKEAEVLNSRMESANTAMSLVEGGLVTSKWIQKHILKFSDEEIEEFIKEQPAQSAEEEL